MCSADIKRDILFDDVLFGLCSTATDFTAELTEMLLGLSSYGKRGRRHVAIRDGKWPMVQIEWDYPFDPNGLRDLLGQRLKGLDFAVSGGSCSFYEDKTRTHGGHPSLDCLTLSAGDARVDLANADAVVVQRGRDPIWIGWYRDAGMECVLWHSHREAIEAVTGRCGCLFDEHLQLWLVPESTVAAFTLSSKSTVTWPA